VKARPVVLACCALQLILAASARAALPLADGPRTPSPARSPVVDRVLDVSDRTVRSGIRETKGAATDLGSARLTPGATKTLAQAGQLLKGRAKGTVNVNGYTDAVGGTAANLELSRARAAAVAQALRPLLSTTGLALQANGFGEANPVAANTLPNGKDNPDGRKLNRRVSLVYRS